MKKIKIINFIILLALLLLAGCSESSSSAPAPTMEPVEATISPVAEPSPVPVPTPSPTSEPVIPPISACPSPESPVCISELRVTDYKVGYDKTRPKSDWVELVNTSSEPFSSGGLYLTDNPDKPCKQAVEARDFSPGKFYVVELAFGLAAEGETLYLTDGERILDSFTYTSFPYYCSVGRMDGSPLACYFETPTPGEVNTDGKHHLSSAPRAAEPDGIFNDISSVRVTLEGDGEIYYTLDGSLPTAESLRYEGPFELDSTTTVRAVCVEEDAVRSFPVSLNYIINEHFTLPVLSIVEDHPSMYSMLEAAHEVPIRKLESPGAVSLYDASGCLFSVNCGTTLAGQASLSTGLYPKISFDVHFRDAYGQSGLGYDLFGTGFDRYASLNVHAGQDSTYLMFDAEIWEDLCLSMCDNVYTQHSRFCILYLNGEYWGIYCLKDDITKQGYADYASVRKAQVEVCESFEEVNCRFCNEVYSFCAHNNLTVEENYETLASKIDIDNYINWLIMQGVSANSDQFSNLKIYSGNGSPWEWALFDLDHAMLVPDHAWDLALGYSFYPAYPNERSKNFIGFLRDSKPFQEALARRYSEVYDTVLSNEKILERIDFYSALLSPEVERDRSRWGYSTEKWKNDVEMLRDVIIAKDWQNFCVDRFCSILNIERELFFD